MSRYKGLIAAVVVAAVILLAGVFYWLNRRRLARLTAEAPAQVTSVYAERTRRRTGNSRRADTETKVSYWYTVGGRTDAGGLLREGRRPERLLQGRGARQGLLQPLEAGRVKSLPLRPRVRALSPRFHQTEERR